MRGASEPGSSDPDEEADYRDDAEIRRKSCAPGEERAKTRRGRRPEGDPSFCLAISLFLSLSISLFEPVETPVYPIVWECFVDSREKTTQQPATLFLRPGGHVCPGDETKSA